MEPNLQLYSRIQAMVQKDARDQALKVYSEKGTQYNVPTVPIHVHNGQDSPVIPFQNLGNNLPYIALATITLTQQQILALNTTPVTLIPAFLNNYILVEAIDVTLSFNSAAYTGANALEFRYTDASGAKVTADIPNTFINSSATAYAHVAGVTTVLTPVVNSPIVVRVPTADPASGNSTMTFTIKYRLINS